MQATVRGLWLGGWLVLAGTLVGCVPPVASSPQAPPPAAVAAAPRPPLPTPPVSQPAPSAAPTTARQQPPSPPPAPPAPAPAPTLAQQGDPEPPSRKVGQPLVIERARKGAAFLVFSPDGKTIALDGDSDSVELWDAETAQLRSTLTGHTRNVQCAAFSRAGRYLAVGSLKQVKLWDTAAVRPLQTLKGHDGPVYFARFSPDGKKLVSGAFDSKVRLWDLTAGKELDTAADMPGNCQNSAASPDGRQLALWGGSNLILLDTSTLARRKLESYAEFFQAVAFTDDGKALVAGCADKVKWFNLAAGQPRVLHDNHTDWVTSVAVTRDGRLVASGSKDRTAILWDVRGNQQRAEIKGYTQPVRVRFFPDGKTLATWAPNENKVRRWDTASGKERTPLRGHTAGVSGVFFSPDGKTVAVPGNDGKVFLWEVADLPD